MRRGCSAAFGRRKRRRPAVRTEAKADVQERLPQRQWLDVLFPFGYFQRPTARLRSSRVSRFTSPPPKKAIMIAFGPTMLVIVIVILTKNCMVWWRLSLSGNGIPSRSDIARSARPCPATGCRHEAISHGVQALVLQRDAATKRYRTECKPLSCNEIPSRSDIARSARQS